MMPKAIITPPPTPRETDIYKLLEGAAGLLVMANRLERIVKESSTDSVKIKKSELHTISKTFRVSAGMVDDLAYGVEIQAEQIKGLKNLVDFLKGIK